jgi:hypothetical protein
VRLPSAHSVYDVGGWGYQVTGLRIISAYDNTGDHNNLGSHGPDRPYRCIGTVRDTN